MKKKLALSAASLLLTFLLAEAALRLLGIAESGRGSPWFAGGNHPRFLFQPDPLSGYTLRPGFRGREIAPSGEFDVPAVYNGGVPGYSSRQMAGLLRRFLPELRPAAVLMTLSPLWDRQRCAAPFLYKEGYIVAPGYADRLVLLDGNLYLKETRLPGIGSATAWIKHHSALARLALPALAGAARSIRRKEEQRPVLADYEPTIRNIQEAQRLTQSFGGRFLVIFIDDRGSDFNAIASSSRAAFNGSASRTPPPTRSFPTPTGTSFASPATATGTPLDTKPWERPWPPGCAGWPAAEPNDHFFRFLSHSILHIQGIA